MKQAIDRLISLVEMKVSNKSVINAEQYAHIAKVRRALKRAIRRNQFGFREIEATLGIEFLP